ncbi:MAG: AbrB/MazE/SpoVT family DNA-binding domain-containing protein [Hyphomicrobium aestuarii]|nr:AbrB/MazE/SpoVT family DNA-binding domain-containing protein [Hyphomicrobium aestuarii]
MHGRSQAVRLPKDFRFEGTEVRISRQGRKVILEPMTPPRFNLDAWLAYVLAYAGDDFPDVADDDPLPPDDNTGSD